MAIGADHPGGRPAPGLRPYRRALREGRDAIKDDITFPSTAVRARRAGGGEAQISTFDLNGEAIDLLWPYKYAERGTR